MRTPFVVVGLIGSVVLASCGGGGSSTSVVEASPSTVEASPPAEFAALYEELSTNLSRREGDLRAGWDGERVPVIHAATLLSASSNNGSKLLDSSFREGNSLILRGLADLGVEGIVLQINYPLLTSGFTGDADAYLTAFAEIADEIRALGLQVIVEHNVLLPGYSQLDPTSYYSDLDKSRFGRERYAEVLRIVERVDPAYLSLVTEPGTFESVLPLGMSVGDWRAYVSGVIDQLAIDAPDRGAKLGAGSGTWESPEFVTTFASIDGVDFIDLHSYPLTNDITDYLELLDTWPAMVRSIDPSLEIISSESWLYKARASELGGTPTDPTFFARDVYGFWEPLDAQFLDVMEIAAQKNGYSVIAPFWSNYFFAYLDYDDPAPSGLTASELQRRAFVAAFTAAQEGRTTELGEHYRRLIEGNAP